ncbi:kelch-like protein 32 [Engraulis encrasicolus]|uniref:kelch-like protein 32 n=1 Tax=Engraulis encrasicolus TaxID=184585 RepID=UPI002FD6B89E
MPSEPPLSSQDMLTGQRLCQSKSHQDAVLSALNQQRKDGLLCDVTLVAEEEKFHAHKAVLAACSDYFRAMFSLCMMESEANEVTLQGVTCVGLKHALDFAYTGQIVLEPGVIQDVLSAGSHLQLLELLNLCSLYLIQELSSLNYLDLYRLADLFHLPALEEAVVAYLVENVAELLTSHQEEVLLLPYRLLSEVLKSDRLTTLSEEEIWQLVMRWLERDCRHQYAEELLQHVRYGLMDLPTLQQLSLGRQRLQQQPLEQQLEQQQHPLEQDWSWLLEEALEYQRSTFAQPLCQTARTRPRFRSLTLYVAGGRKREVSRVRELRYFNPCGPEYGGVGGGGDWSELSPMPAGRSHHCVAVMGHFLFVAGGEVEQSNGRTCAVRSACRYDPRTDHWADIAPMKACREHFVLGTLGQFLFAVGGRNELRQVLPSVERYCPQRNKWSYMQPFDRALSCHAGCVADGLLWVSGGVTNTAQYQNRLMVYDPEQDGWSARSPMLQRRVYHVMAGVRRQLYVLGGNDLDYNNDRILVRHIDSYNIDTDQWTRCSFSLLTGQNEAGVAVHEDRIYVVGGYSIWTNEPLACIQVLDVSVEGKGEVFYGPSLPFASNGIATCFLPAPHFTCPNLQSLQVPQHRIGTL